jgi:hypothetical protein
VEFSFGARHTERNKKGKIPSHKKEGRYLQRERLGDDLIKTKSRLSPPLRIAAQIKLINYGTVLLFVHQSRAAEWQQEFHNICEKL